RQVRAAQQDGLALLLGQQVGEERPLVAQAAGGAGVAVDEHVARDDLVVVGDGAGAGNDAGLGRVHVADVALVQLAVRDAGADAGLVGIGGLAAFGEQGAGAVHVVLVGVVHVAVRLRAAAAARAGGGRLGDVGRHGGLVGSGAGGNGRTERLTCNHSSC